MRKLARKQAAQKPPRRQPRNRPEERHPKALQMAPKTGFRKGLQRGMRIAQKNALGMAVPEPSEIGLPVEPRSLCATCPFSHVFAPDFKVHFDLDSRGQTRIGVG